MATYKILKLKSEKTTGNLYTYVTNDIDESGIVSDFSTTDVTELKTKMQTEAKTSGTDILQPVVVLEFNTDIDFTDEVIDVE